MTKETLLMQYRSGCLSALEPITNMAKPFEKVFMDTMKLFMVIPGRIIFSSAGTIAKHLLGSIYRNRYILTNFFSKPYHQLASGIKLPSADQVWQIVFTLIMQTMKKEVLTVEAKCLGCYAECNDFKVRKLRDNITSRHISESINTIPGEIFADFKDSDEICYEVAHSIQRLEHY